MARTVEQIKQYIYDQMALKPSLADLLANPSQVAVWKDFVHAIAVEMAVFEQLMDAKKDELEELVRSAVVPSEAWVQEKAFEFQYDAITPQIIQIIDLVPTYDPIDETKRIITRCAVVNVSAGQIYVRVAKSDPPVPLSAPELTALQGYFNSNTAAGAIGDGGIGFAGVDIVCQSLTADKLWIDGTVYYNAQYKDVIQANVILAINNYLGDLPPNGYIRVQYLKAAIMAVDGVIDLHIEGLARRADATAFASRTFLIQNGDELTYFAATAAGYVVEETTAGETFADKLLFTAAFI